MKHAHKTKPRKAAPPVMPDPYEVGTVMKDGTIYGGISPNTHKPMFVAPKSSPNTMMFKKAAEYAKSLEVGGHHDFRVPTQAELRVLFKNRDKGALKGTFNAASDMKNKKDAKNTKNYYWSSEHNGWNQRIGCNILHDPTRDNNAFVRCIR